MKRPVTYGLPIRSRVEGKRRYDSFQCSVCDAEFERRSDHPTRANDGIIACSPCRRALSAKQAVGRKLPSMHTGRELDCDLCGKSFYRSAANIGPGRHYCSAACRTEGIKDRPPVEMIRKADNSGSKNGRYKHGLRVGKHVNNAKVRAEVIDRDGDWCLLCGKPPSGLHLHRVVYGSQGGKYELGNCVQLCADHHALVHSSKSTWMPLLLAHLAGEPDALTELRRIYREAA